MPFGQTSRLFQPAPRFKRHVSLDARDSAFVSMLPAFRESGGLATGEEIGARFARRQHDGISNLARRVAADQLISFHWHANLWLPMFQFDHETMEMTRGAHLVFGELSRFMDGWEMTHWFATPHASLCGSMPVAMLDLDQGATLNAARLDRFIALG
ncbi:hypothetical protein QTH87_21680 [Variovorax sp. J22P168]|nr:hypothetical protein [Variovorax sp. J22P168]